MLVREVIMIFMCDENVVKIYGWYKDDINTYIVMEYCGCGSVENFIR